MATLLYLERNGNYDEEKAIKILLETKNYLKIEEIIKGLNNLKRFMLTKERFEIATKGLREEIELWDSTSNDGLQRH